MALLASAAQLSPHLASRQQHRTLQMNDSLSATGRIDDDAPGSPKRKKVRAKYAPKAWYVASATFAAGPVAIPTVPHGANSEATACRVDAPSSRWAFRTRY